LSMTEDLRILAEELVDFCNQQESGYVKLRLQIEKLFGAPKLAAVKEETFIILRWEDHESNKIGQYSVAYKPNNLKDRWTHAYNILRQNNATISSRYHGEGYQFSYWIYAEDKIYRQKKKQKTSL
jgi:hypothetical protein